MPYKLHDPNAGPMQKNYAKKKLLVSMSRISIYTF